MNLILFLSLFHLYSATESPIIGILTQPDRKCYHFDTYIAASYVKFVESAGARAIPIWINQTMAYYERVINYTNGVLFPGGSASFKTPGGYGDTARTLYHLARKSNEEGIFFPVWGTCLGFQVLPYAQVGHDIRVNCSVVPAGLPLEFTKKSKESRLFGHISSEIYDILSTQEVTFNHHKYCLTHDSLKSYGLHQHWQILATNTDGNGMKFISAMENMRYPFYGVQFHPEKNGFEFGDHYKFPHGSNSIKVMQYFANFFVNESRRNQNNFPSNEVALKSMIYNFGTKFSGLDHKLFYLIYGFYENDYSTNQLLSVFN